MKKGRKVDTGLCVTWLIINLNMICFRLYHNSESTPLLMLLWGSLMVKLSVICSSFVMLTE